MSLRTLLVVLITAATAMFVVGVSIERGNETGHHEPGEISHAESGEAAEASHSDEARHPGQRESDAELRPLGIDVEASPFVAAAALASLTLATAAWLRQRRVDLLALVAAAMLAFAVLDVLEIFHQADIDETALAVLAGAVAALHVAAAGVAAAMGAGARRGTG